MIRKIYRTVQALSLDIVIGVVILLRFFCVQFGVEISWHVYTLLAVAVWVIYTVDHLQDADRASSSSRFRYQFHLNNRKVLVGLVIGCVVLILPLLLYIPRLVLLGGLILSGLSCIYLLVQQKLSTYLFKELYVALIYSLGILMTPFLMAGRFDWTALICLFLLTFSNLIIFSWYEEVEDLEDGFQSLATRLGQKQLEKFIVILISLGISINIISDRNFFTFFLIGFAIYALILILPTWFKKDFRYRLVGDAVFLLPIIYEWV